MTISEKVQEAQKRMDAYCNAIKAVESLCTTWDIDYYTDCIKAERAKEEPNEEHIKSYEATIALEQKQNERYIEIAEQLYKLMLKA